MNKFQNVHLSKEEEKAGVRGRGGDGGGREVGGAGEYGHQFLIPSSSTLHIL